MKAGKPAVWSTLNFYMGEPILKAMDLEVVYPENYGAVLAATGVAQRYFDQSDTDGFPTHLCGYSRLILGYTSRMMKDLKGEVPPEAPLGGMPKPLFLVCSTPVCDARYKWFQALGRYMDVPVWSLELPSPGVKEFFIEGSYQQVLDFVVENLRAFISFVENMAGKKMDWNKLDETVDLMIEISRVWYEINELRKAKPSPMHSRDFWSAMPPALNLAGDLKVSLLLYRNMYQEVKHRVNSHIGAIPEEKYRLLFAEIPPWHSLGFFDKLVERGWNFVIESIIYRPPIPLDLSGVSDPLERTAKFILQLILGYYEDAMRREALSNPYAVPHLKYAEDWKCDGAVLHPVATCRSASVYLPYISNMLMEKLKVPSLFIEGDSVDRRLFNSEDALAKIELFEETMEHFKKVRRQERLD